MNEKWSKTKILRAVENFFLLMELGLFPETTSTEVKIPIDYLTFLKRYAQRLETYPTQTRGFTGVKVVPYWIICDKEKFWERELGQFGFAYCPDEKRFYFVNSNFKRRFRKWIRILLKHNLIP